MLRKGMIIVVLGLLLLTQMPAVNAQASWYNASWDFRKQITIDNNQVENESFENFAILISITTDTSLAANAQNDGDDILFTSSDGTTKIPHEIENFAGDNGQLVAWVRIPTLYDNENTIIFMYYGNAGASNQENVTGVWDSYYLGVYHLDHTSGNANDSTGTLNISEFISPDSNMDVDGQIFKGDNFDGNDYLGGSPKWNADDTNGTDHTYSAWVRFETVHKGIIIEDGGSGNGDGLGTLDNGVIKYQQRDSNTTYSVESNDNIADGGWHFVVGVFTEASQLEFYTDGELDDTTTGDDGTIGTGDGRIGRANGPNGVYNDSNNHYFIGALDEIRISSNERNANFILTRFRNENNPETFFTLGLEEPDEWFVIEEWSGRAITNPRIISIDYPLIALPRSMIYISQCLTTAENAVENISAVISFSDDNFAFITHHDENDNQIENCPANGEVLADWITSPPSTPGAYEFNITWDFDYNGNHGTIISDNYSITTRYPSGPVSIDPRMTEAAFILLVLIAYGLFLLGMFGRINPHSRIYVYLLAMLFLFVTAVASVLFDNYVIGLLNVGLGIIAGALAVIHSTEEL